MADEHRKALHEERLRLIKAWENHSGTAFINELERLDASYFIFCRNYEEFASKLREYESDYTLVGDSERERFRFAMRETYRFLHNYLASIYSLKEHTVRFIDEECPGLKTEYVSEVITLESNGCVSFAKQFRNFLQHRMLPIASMTLHLERIEIGKPDMKSDVSVWISAKELLEWDKWNMSSKGYLQSLGDKIKLSTLFDQGHRLRMEFYIKVRAKSFEAHREEITESQKIMEQILQIETKMG